MSRLVTLLFLCFLVYHYEIVQALTPIKTPRREFKGLDAARFRHPLDRDLTSLLQRLPGGNLVELGIRRSFPMMEQGVRLDLLSTSVKVSEQQLPDLFQSMKQACQVLDLKPLPDLYVQSNPIANAYTLALQNPSSRPIVVVTSALLDQCNESEIQAVLGHELGHLVCEHSLYLTAGGLVSTPLRNLPLLGSSVDSTLQQWRLAAEYTCDRAALLVTQDVEVVASALLKLFAGTGNKYAMNVQAFCDQCLEYDELLQSANPLVRMAIQQQLRQRTHPLPVRRVAELQAWAQSDDYARILAKGKPLNATEKKEE